jgi:hypothetical protein
MENPVLAVLPGHMAVVSTEDLYRVVINPGAESLHEFMTKERADDEAARFNRCCRSAVASVVGY